MMHFNRNRGFSLVELLVAISIIGILAAAGFASYTSANQNSRNGRRRADVEKLRSALELYRADHGYYPSAVASSRNIKVGADVLGRWDKFMLEIESYLGERLSDPLIEDAYKDDLEKYNYKYVGGELDVGGWGLGTTTKGTYIICIDIEPLAQQDDVNHLSVEGSQECYRQPE